MPGMKIMSGIFVFSAGCALAVLWFMLPDWARMWAFLSQNANTIVIGATALLAAIIAVWGVISQRAIARRQMTYEQIIKFITDDDLIKARRKFMELARSADGLKKYAAKENEISEETQSIILTLNFFELISIGIQRGIIDYELFKMWGKTSVVQIWSYAHAFVEPFRERLGNDMLFHELQSMAGWFKASSAPPKRRWWFRQFF
jgi:hypothetical protein